MRKKDHSVFTFQIVHNSSKRYFISCAAFTLKFNKILMHQSRQSISSINSNPFLERIIPVFSNEEKEEIDQIIMINEIFK